MADLCRFAGLQPALFRRSGAQEQQKIRREAEEAVVFERRPHCGRFGPFEEFGSACIQILGLCLKRHAESPQMA